MLAFLTISVFFERSVSVRKWYINEQTAHFFIEVMSTSVSPRSETVDVLLDNSECKTLKLIDVIAPEKQRILSGKQKATWRNSPAVYIFIYTQMCQRIFFPFFLTTVCIYIDG